MSLANLPPANQHGYLGENFIVPPHDNSVDCLLICLKHYSRDKVACELTVTARRSQIDPNRDVAIELANFDAINLCVSYQLGPDLSIIVRVLGAL